MRETWECDLTEITIACEVLVAAMSQKNFIIKIKCFFLLGALLSPIHCVLLLLCYIFVFFVSFCCHLCSSASLFFCSLLLHFSVMHVSTPLAFLKTSLLSLL